MIHHTCTITITKVYLRLNHLNVCISYPAKLSLVVEISKRHREPLERWIESGEDFKFVGDNVAKRKVVRDIRSDHHSHLVQMYSILAVKSRVIHPPSPTDFSPPKVTSVSTDQCVPTEDDVQSIKQNLIVLVSRTVCKYIKCLQKYAPSVCSHIAHAHSKEMATKSEAIVLDVLHTNETKGADMIDIMREMHDYLGDSSKIRPSGGDYLTVERQRCSQQHLMDSDTQRGRLGAVCRRLALFDEYPNGKKQYEKIFLQMYLQYTRNQKATKKHVINWLTDMSHVHYFLIYPVH